MENKKCTSCGGDATVAFVNDAVDEKHVHGMVIRPQERICMSCAEARGITLFENYEKGKTKY